MYKTQIWFTIALVFTTHTADISQKGFVFDKGTFTEIYGNRIWAYLYFGQYQKRVIPGFEHIRVIELTKDKKFKEIGTLRSLEKGSIFALKDFEEHTQMHNAIACYNVEQVEDYDGEMCSIAGILYGTRDLKYCSLLQEYIMQQKAAKQKAANTVEQK